MREVMSDVASSVGATVVEILWDAEKFFDNIDPSKLTGLALAKGYPAVQLFMGLQMHLAARVAKASGAVS